MARPLIKFSREIDEKKSIIEHLDKPFGYSLIAMTMLNDSKKENLSIELQFSDVDQLRDCSQYLRGTWAKSESYPCGFRCVVVDDKPQTEYEGKTHSIETAPPASEEDYKKCKFLIDSFFDEQSHVFKIYNWPSSIPKTVKLFMQYDEDATA